MSRTVIVLICLVWVLGTVSSASAGLIAHWPLNGTAKDTADGIGALIVYVQGRVGNAAAPLYVALEDASKHVAIVAYSDTALTRATTWTRWKIPLSDFAGVNLAKATKLYIGVGDRKNPVAGGTGRICIDDICVAKS